MGVFCFNVKGLDVQLWQLYSVPRMCEQGGNAIGRIHNAIALWELPASMQELDVEPIMFCFFSASTIAIVFN